MTYDVAREDAIRRVVKAYVNGCSDVRGGMGNVLIQFAIDSKDRYGASGHDDVIELVDALERLARMYEGK